MSTIESSTTRQPTAVEVRKALKSDWDKLRDVMARAFDDDPIANWFCAQDDKRVARLKKFFDIAVTRMASPHDEMYTTAGIEGGALWFPPDKWKMGMIDQLKLVPSMIGVTSLRRLPGVMNGLNAVEKVHPQKPHFYLMALGVEPEMQGRSIGTQLMRPVLERCDSEGIPAYLESSKERNVPLYERNGFKVTQEFQVPYNGPKIWLMWRDPQ